MYSEYNWILLSKFFKESDEIEIKNLLEEMSLIKDWVFLQPIFDKFNLYKDKSFSHYFLVTISELNCNKEELEKIIETLLIENTEEYILNHIRYVINLFKKIKKYDDIWLNLCKKTINNILFDFQREEETKDFDIIWLLPYIKNFPIDIQNDFHDSLIPILIHKNIYDDEFNNIIEFLIKNNKFDILNKLSKINWNDKIHIKRLIQILWKYLGNSFVKTILDYLSDLNYDLYLKVKINEITFLNQQIKEKQNKLNDITIKSFGFNIVDFSFIDFWISIDEVKLESFLKNYRIYIQSIWNKIDNKDIPYSIDDKKQLYSNSDENNFNKSLFKTYFYLKSKGFEILPDLYSINKLNGIASKTMHKNFEEIKLILNKELDMNITYKNIIDVQVILMKQLISSFEKLITLIVE